MPAEPNASACVSFLPIIYPMKTPKTSTSPQTLTRREFVGRTFATAGVIAGAPAFLRGQNLNSRLRLAVIGTGGRGGGNLKGVGSEDIVALCDGHQHQIANGQRVYEMFEASETLASGGILSLEEKFLAGEGQNITPARYAKDKAVRQKISEQVKTVLKKTAEVLNVEGYCRIDAFVHVYENNRAETTIIEINSLPGMTPATVIFHQAALNGYKPYEFIDNILQYGRGEIAS